jgi:hypothetical protein
MFSLSPMIIIEWFGLPRFSRNWGTVAISPVLGGNIFSLAFGMNLDRHASRPTIGDGSNVHRGLFARGGLPDTSDHLCFDGLECYQSSLKLTTLACIAATVLSIVAFRRDRYVYALRERHIAHASEVKDSDNHEAQRTVPAEEERLLSSNS